MSKQEKIGKLSYVGYSELGTTCSLFFPESGKTCIIG